MIDKLEGIEGKVLEYKGKPLVRQDDDLYYGSMSDKYILFMMVMDYKDEDEKVPGKILLQIISTNDDKQILKQGSANGLYEALDLGGAWLERANRA